MKRTSKMTETLFRGLIFILLLVLAFASQSAAQLCTPPPPGMVSWWDGDAVSGTTAFDIQDGNDGTLMNGANTAIGKVGQAFSLDGVDDFVEIADSTNLRPTSAITVDAWVKVDSIPDGGAVHIIDRHSSEGGKPLEGYLLSSYGDGPFVFWLVTNPNNPNQNGAIGNTHFVGDGKFHHVAGTYDGSFIKIYVDGVLEGSAPASGSIVYATTLNLLLGANQQPSEYLRHVQGLIDEIEIYNRALSQSEIQAIFLAGSAGKCNVEIDIKPASFPNSINPRNKGKIPVAILTTNTFDATTVDTSTVFFGATGAEAPPVHAALKDVDGDGDIDLILHFNTQATSIGCGDTAAGLTGKTFDGQMIRGSDSISTVGCK